MIPTIHILNVDRNNSLCQGAVFADKAITMNMALQGTFFSCLECRHKLRENSMDYEGAELYTGQAVGGPLDGEMLSSRFPNGVLVVDKSNSLVHIYDFLQGKFN